MSTFVIDIRPARAEDGPGIARVHDEVWRYAYRGIIPGRELERMVERRGPVWWRNVIARGSQVLVLTAGDDIAGYASIGRSRSSSLPADGEIYELYVRPEFQGTGFGRRLFERCIKELERRGFEGLVVWALADNDAGCAFYRALGGQAAARTQEQFAGIALEKLAFTWP